MTRLDTTAPIRATKRTPVRGLEMPDAWVPVVLGLGVGVVVFLAAWPVAGLANRLAGHWLGAHYTGRTAVLAALSVGFVAGAVVALRGAREVLRGMPLLWSSEEEAEVIQPPASPSPAALVEVEVTDLEGAWRKLSLPFEESSLREFAQGVVSGGRGLSLGDWTGSGRPFSRAEYMALREELMRRRLAYWLNPRAKAQGWNLTEAGWQMVKELAGTPLLGDGE